MKQKYCLLALTGLLMASCSNENDPFGPVTQPSSGELTFVFPGTAKGVVPYADVIASAAENELKTLDIYVFGEDTLGISGSTGKMLLEGIFRSGVAAGGGATEGEQGYALNVSGDSKTATISVGSGQKKSFYFVANGREHSSLNEVRLHTTDTTEFKTKMSNKLQGHIACPMLMSAAMHTTDVATFSKTNQSITLIRRMARFDIQNSSDKTNFTIRKIILENAPQDVPLFDTPTYAATNRLPKFPVIDFLSLAGSNAGMANSVFYMYPIDDPKDVTLKLAGIISSGGAAQIVNVPLKNYKDLAKFIKIAPNNRYLVDVEQTGSGTLAATLTVSEWIVGDTIQMNTGYGSIKLSGAAGLAGNTLTVAAEPEAPATIQVTADSEWKLVVDPACADWVEVEQIAAVAPEVMSKTFTVKTTKANPSSVSPREGIVMVQNVTRPSIRQPLIVKQSAQDKLTSTRYIDLSGAGMNGNALLISGTQPAEVVVDVAAAAEWTATSKATWITLGTVMTKAAGNQTHTGPGKFPITVEENTTATERVDTVKITITGQDNLVQSLIVRQAPRNLGSITVAIAGMKDDLKVAVPAAGFYGKAETPCIVSVKATTEWTYEITTGDDWLTEAQAITLAKGTFNGTFQLKAAANETDAARTATVTVKNTVDGTIQQVITFTQAAGQVTPPPAEVTIADIADQTIDVAGTTEEKLVPVTCSVAEWTVTNDSDAGWLTTTKVDNTIKLVAAAYTGGAENRTATVTVTSGSVSKDFTVTQSFE